MSSSSFELALMVRRAAFHLLCAMTPTFALELRFSVTHGCELSLRETFDAHPKFSVPKLNFRTVHRVSFVNALTVIMRRMLRVDGKRWNYLTAELIFHLPVDNC